VKKNCGYKLLLHFFKGIVYNFFIMKKKFLKGEISTIIGLGTLIVLGVSSLVSTVFLKKPQTTKTKAAGCAKVEDVSYSGDVAAGKTFTCLASTDGASPYTMACGISKNGGWPYGMQSGSCSGTSCTFSVKMDDQVEAGAVYYLVAFDFRTECGPDKDTAKRIPLNVPGTQPQPTQANCDQECCGMPDGFIYQRAIKARCDSNYKGGRYVIIDGVCQGGKKTEKPGCATCRTCQAGAHDISPVPGADLAVNECTSSCEQSSGGICSNLPNCPANITPAIVRSCSDTSFSCTPGYTACKKDGVIWCYGSGRSGGGSREGGSSGGGNSPPAGITPRGGEGQPCIEVYDSASKKYQYYCNKNLVCSKQSPDGICVNPNPNITPRGGEGQPCIEVYDSASKKYQYYCNKNLVCSKQSPDGICVNPNPNITPRGGEGQPCIEVYDSASKKYQYYCNKNLVCSKQSPDGICVNPNPNITPRGGEGQLCEIGTNEYGVSDYYCKGNLVCTEESPKGICVTPTPTPTKIVTPGVTVKVMLGGSVVATYDCGNPNLPPELKDGICKKEDGYTLDSDLTVVDEKGGKHVIPRATRITKKDNKITVKFVTSEGRAICSVGFAALSIASGLVIISTGGLSTPVVVGLLSGVGLTGIGGIVSCVTQ
jgi:hypothetical protein